jgi:hypothetical protein
LRREEIEVGTWDFLRIGFMVMPIALVLSILAMIWSVSAFNGK